MKKIITIKQKIAQDAIDKFNARCASYERVYGQLSQPAIYDGDVEDYLTIDMSKSAIMLLNISEHADGYMVEYKLAGKLSTYVPKNYDLCVRAIVLNEVIVNIITIDVKYDRTALSNSKK